MMRSRKISFIIRSHHSLVKPLKTFVVGLGIGELEQQDAVKLIEQETIGREARWHSPAVGM